LFELFSLSLGSNNKIISLLAAKSYYFGVGGGTRLFEAALKEDGALKSEVIWTCEEGWFLFLFRYVNSGTYFYRYCLRRYLIFNKPALKCKNY
jgi:hypothetical protein